MGIRETSLGGAQEGFPDTVASLLGDPALSPSEREARLNRLFTSYWRPIYAVIRAAHGRSIEDAKDLTQGFFRYLLEGEVLANYDPAKGRFRHFLRGTLRNFLMKERRDGSTQKRGGGAVTVSLDTGDFDTEEFLRSARAEDPDRLFDRQWADDVVARSVIRLRTLLAGESKETYFKVYEALDLCPAGREKPTYEELARTFSISTGDVKNYLYHARTRLEQLIVQTVREYAGSRDELKDEMRELFRE